MPVLSALAARSRPERERCYRYLEGRLTQTPSRPGHGHSRGWGGPARRGLADVVPATGISVPREGEGSNPGGHLVVVVSVVVVEMGSAMAMKRRDLVRQRVGAARRSNKEELNS